MLSHTAFYDNLFPYNCSAFDSNFHKFSNELNMTFI